MSNDSFLHMPQLQIFSLNIPYCCKISVIKLLYQYTASYEIILLEVGRIDIDNI